MQRCLVTALIAFLIITGTVLVFFKPGTTSPIVGVQALGHIAVGSEAVTGRGSHTFAPYFEIPSARFYVMVIENDLWCSNESCSFDGHFIQTMGGWLQAEMTCCGSEIKYEIGLDLPENAEVKTLVVVSDSNDKIVGIYPNRGLKDVLPILRLHPDLADFSFLAGAHEFGALDVGEPAPLWPGDQISYLSDKFAQSNTAHVPKGKKFYLYSVEKRKSNMIGGTPAPYEGYVPHENTYLCFAESCRYPDPDPPHDFFFAEVYDLGGWFLANDMDSPEMPKLFGLDPEAVLRGDSSLVVLTDSKGIIIALHPGKTLADTFTILSQHPDLADMRKFYRR